MSVIRDHLGQDRIRMAFSEYSHVLTICKGLLKRFTAHGEVNSSLCPLLFAFRSGQFKANKMVLQIFVQRNVRCNCTQRQGFSSKYLQPLLHQILKRTKNGFHPERRCRVGRLPSCLVERSETQVYFKVDLWSDVFFWMIRILNTSSQLLCLIRLYHLFFHTHLL